MEKYDVVVCGGGVAGVMAAISAARNGANTLLLERGGCLGGMWTAGLLGYTIDFYNKPGLLREFIGRLDRETEKGAVIYEAQKYILEDMCMQAGVHVLYHSVVCSCEVDNRKIQSIEYVCKSGKCRVTSKMWIDSTGDGDLAVMAGCGYDLGREEDGLTQPMSMIAVVTGLQENEIKEYIAYPRCDFWEPRKRVIELFQKIGADYSIGCPSFQKINSSLYYLTVNHEYQKRADSEEDITNATIHARKEINLLVELLREKGGPAFRNIAVAATPDMMGVREGRRIHGVYTITIDDLIEGKQHDDAVCLVTYWVDLHDLLPNNGKGYMETGINVKPYHIPFRALLPVDCDNLVMAGRSISGDFYAHASYRVAGNMAAVGEAAGLMSAVSAKNNLEIKSLLYQDYRVGPASDR